jgi:hypothetical protein
MNEQDSDILVQHLYDSIFDSLTEGVGHSRAAFDPSKIFFTLEPRGRIIYPEDFVGAWTPANPAGSHGAALNICEIANEAPILCARHTRGPATVSELYEQVLRATLPAAKQSSEAAKHAYKIASSFLNTRLPNHDVQGKFVPQQTQVYGSYKAGEIAYRNAVSALRSAHSLAVAARKLKATWPLLEAALEARVHKAWESWRSSDAHEVEAALAVLEKSGVDQVERAFADASELFENYKMPFVEGEPRLRSSLIPFNWGRPSASDGWPSMHFNNATTAINPGSDYLKYCGGGGFSVGLWSAGDRACASSPSFHCDAAADSINISFQYKLIAICRPWLVSNLFKLPGWKMDRAQKGMLSSGSRTGQETTLFPLLPQAFLAIKNLTVTGSFSSSELNQVNSLIDAHVPLGFGPFAVSGSSIYGGRGQFVRGTVGPSGLRVPFIQIIGWVNTILLFCPPE